MLFCIHYQHSVHRFNPLTSCRDYLTIFQQCFTSIIARGMVNDFTNIFSENVTNHGVCLLQLSQFKRRRLMTYLFLSTLNN